MEIARESPALWPGFFCAGCAILPMPRNSAPAVL
jgi:hypothetical protein